MGKHVNHIPKEILAEIKGKAGNDRLLFFRLSKSKRRELFGRHESDRKKKLGKDRRSWWCAQARRRGRKMGLEATIQKTDLSWPDVCPVLGIVLDYDTRDPHAQNAPSLDRHDNTKGYVKGNVFVISKRANFLKGNGTPGELEAVADYAKNGPLTI